MLHEMVHIRVSILNWFTLEALAAISIPSLRLCLNYPGTDFLKAGEKGIF